MKDGRLTNTVIDWLKATAFIDQSRTISLVNNLDFKSEINECTGEITEWPKRFNYANLEFVLIPAEKMPGYWLEVSGSIHRFWEGKTNYRPFNYSDICYTINFLSFVCSIPPSCFMIKQIEFGVNILDLGISTHDILDNLIAYKDKIFAPMKTKGNKCIGSCATLTDYIIKIYDKAAQFNLPHPAIRIEVQARQHVGRMIGVESLESITDLSVLIAIGNELSKIISRIVLDDPHLPIDKLQRQQKDFFVSGRNPRYYKNFTSEERKRFKRILNTYGIKNYANMLRLATEKVWQTSLNMNSQII